MSDLVEFLKARLDEDERAARKTKGRGMTVSLPAFMVDHMTRWDPARVLREVAAKRRILELGICCACAVEKQPCDHRDATLRLLAFPYSTHPDYRQEWRP